MWEVGGIILPRGAEIWQKHHFETFCSSEIVSESKNIFLQTCTFEKKTPAARIGQLWHLLSIHLNVTMVWFPTLEFRRNRSCKTLPATHCTGKLTVACTQCHAKMLPNLQRPVVSLTGHNFVAKISITFRVWAYNAKNGHDVIEMLLRKKNTKKQEKTANGRKNDTERPDKLSWRNYTPKTQIFKNTQKNPVK